jgi:hypothetical protein
MENFKPTHFTVQFNASEGYDSDGMPHWNHRLHISILKDMKESYEKLISMRPVAIFKIQFKKQAR